jgi:hypothetical protein
VAAAEAAEAPLPLGLAGGDAVKGAEQLRRRGRVIRGRMQVAGRGRRARRAEGAERTGQQQPERAGLGRALVQVSSSYGLTLTASMR